MKISQLIKCLDEWKSKCGDVDIAMVWEEDLDQQGFFAFDYNFRIDMLEIPVDDSEESFDKVLSFFAQNFVGNEESHLRPVD